MSKALPPEKYLLTVGTTAQSPTHAGCEGGLHVLLDGPQLADLVSLYQKLAKDLSFPNYFSYNLDAFDEIMHDLSWIYGKQVVIYLVQYPNWLAKEAEEKRKQVLAILVDAAHAGFYSLQLNDSPENRQYLDDNDVPYALQALS